ncbi:MAG: hypothetical protein IT306_12195 [Chloroflexi bacterium]|nr:hypothetical protein [Chloroflexota bacterium]
MLVRRLCAALMIAIVVESGAIVPAAFSPSAISVVEAAPAQGKDRDNKDRKNQGSDDDEDHTLNGQVLEIDTLKDPPELVLGSVDGLTVIRVLKTDEIAINGVRLGDYIQAKGEKQSEVLFEATELSVSEHYTAPSDDGKKKH